MLPYVLPLLALHLQPASPLALVALDWSEAKAVWANEHPMDAESLLVSQARKLKQSNPSARVLLYRNSLKSLSWFPTITAAIKGTPGLFLPFSPTNPAPHSPPCDATFSPPLCSHLYHDLVQTPRYPNNSKYDGTCAAPCDCGGIPCGEYLYDFTAPGVQPLFHALVMGPTGMGSGVVDGFFMDDSWSNHTQVGSNACDGSPIGGPSEVDSFCISDMGLSHDDTLAQTAGWEGTLQSIAEEVNAAGGFLWNQMTQVSTPPPGDPSACAAFFRGACGPNGAFLDLPILHTFTEAPGRVFDPLPAFPQDQATFQLIRGGHAWLGFAWNGCSFGGFPSGGRHNQTFTFPTPAINADLGDPVGVCTETIPGVSGVFTRAFTKSRAEFDCEKWVGNITLI